jgi:hypothetical protein
LFELPGAKLDEQEGHLHCDFKDWVLYLVASAVATNLEHRGWMKLLCASSDLGELKELVKRLVRFGIPCAVCKDCIDSQLSVWIQQDNHFPLALKVFVERDKPRPLPHWASLLDLAAPATEDSALPAPEDFGLRATEDFALAAPDGIDITRAALVQSKGPTRTGST